MITGRRDRWLPCDHAAPTLCQSTVDMKTLPIASLIIALLTGACTPPLKLAPDDAAVVLARHTIDAPDPAQRGPYLVQRLYYGSGTDRNRAVYRDSVRIRTEPVDASKLVDLGTNAKSRNEYWGFTPKEMPLNGRVWYPAGGNGPFPLVLIVHGNHNMKDFSDPGYGYLGELLASRGYIFASVDMNFINGAIRGENDARGWFLLKHVEVFRKFNDTPGNPFFRMVDVERVVLIGHSRGGEAVGHAAAFNRLEYYPDDANVRFVFGFGVRGIVAIAPVDGQYRPADRLVPVRDVNYLVFHGSHDGDVTSFMGIRQFQRVAFSGRVPAFKSAVYVYRANHGQWNTVWGAHDNGPRSGRILDLRGLMPPADQRRFAEVYISAFLEVTLRDDKRYLPLFRDHRVAGRWLPRTMYITRYEDASFRPIATFEEDVDLASASLTGVRIQGDSVATWREGGLNLRSQSTPDVGSTMQNHAVWVGWNNRIEGDPDTTRLATPAALTLTFDDGARRALALDTHATLDFLLLPTDALPPPRKPATSEKKDSEKKKETARTQSARPTKPPARKGDAKPPVDLSVAVTDVNGVTVSVPLGRYGAIRHPLEMNILRRADLEKTRFARLYEMLLQSYSIPFADLQAAAPRLDVSRIATIRFVFDRVPAGTVIIDDVGFSRIARW
jgi:dienelactone hydrolase